MAMLGKRIPGRGMALAKTQQREEPTLKKSKGATVVKTHEPRE